MQDSIVNISGQRSDADHSLVLVLSPDSLVRRDSIMKANMPHSYGLVMEKKLQEPVLRQTPADADAVSWIYIALIILFAIACLRFRKNTRYLKAVINDLIEVRERQNIFDGTVRETSFMMLMNLIWIASAGVVLYKFLVWFSSGALPEFSSLVRLPEMNVTGIGICAGVMLVYSILMSGAYWVVGNVFSDNAHTLSWLKGFWASQAMAGTAFLPLSPVLLGLPGTTDVLLIVCASIYLLTKLLFIYKGFRIFFTQISSWLLFLYYLCSLEVVPLILTIAGAYALCCEVI